jgi:hypothetical protein
VIASAAAIGAMWAPLAQAAERAPSCKRAHSKTVAKNRLVRVYTVRRSGATALYACRRSTGRRVRLASAFDDDLYTTATFNSVRLKGYYVAWASSFTDVSCKADCPPGYQPLTESIRIYNVRRRRSRAVAGYPFSRALVLSKRGAVAWASRSGATGPVEIRASVRAGDNRALDSGNIDPKSLAIEITIISWTRDGLERFARLR